ncbi:hypothetical protein DRQ29_03960 [bacterium]|nr:MAG: hypothetical protein DRQ29_03960 [bacterium]
MSLSNRELSDARTQTEKLETLSNEINSKLTGAQREQTAISIQIENFQQSFDSSQQSLNSIDKQIGNNNDNISQWQTELEQIEELYDSIVIERDKLDGKIFQFEQNHRELDGKLAGKQVERVGIEGEIRTAENEIERSNITIADSEKKIGEIERAVKNAKITIDDSNSKVNELKAAVQKLFDESDKIEREREKIRAEMDECAEEISHRNKSERELSAKKDSIQETIATLNEKLAGNRALLEQIRTDAKREFGEIPSLNEQFTEKDEIRLQTKSINAKRRLEQSGGVNLEAEEQYDAVKNRLDFLIKQKTDITKSTDDLKQTIDRLDTEATRLFVETFEQARIKFKEIFAKLFEGGEADLLMKNSDKPLTSDILVKVKPAGKKTLHLSQLSAGEKAMTSLALLFGLYLVKPSPFCLMDEVDAPLDDANIGRFLTLVQKFSLNIQFIIISHNKRTLEHADFLYGVSMEQDGVSRIVSIKMSDLKLDLK